MPAAAPAPKPYLYAEELAALTPWSSDEIDAMVKRGLLRLGVHYFQAQRGARRIFKWSAIVELIESGAGDHTAASGTHGNRDGKVKVIDVEEATERLRRLHG
jgi:hypothetical protein